MLSELITLGLVSENSKISMLTASILTITSFFWFCERLFFKIRILNLIGKNSAFFPTSIFQYYLRISRELLSFSRRQSSKYEDKRQLQRHAAAEPGSFISFAKSNWENISLTQDLFLLTVIKTGHQLSRVTCTS